MAATNESPSRKGLNPNGGIQLAIIFSQICHFRVRRAVGTQGMLHRRIGKVSPFVDQNKKADV
jgi:hypothetical protein